MMQNLLHPFANVSRPRRPTHHFRGRQIRPPPPHVLSNSMRAVAGLSSDLTTRSHLFLLHGHVHTLPHRYVHNPIHVPHRNRSARYLGIRHTRLPRAARRQAGFFNFMKLPKSTPVAFASIQCCMAIQYYLCRD